MGVNLIPVELPDLPYGAMRSILLAEAAAAFDDLTRSGKDKLLTQQSKDDWPNTFRAARFIPAVTPAADPTGIFGSIPPCQRANPLAGRASDGEPAGAPSFARPANNAGVLHARRTRSS